MVHWMNLETSATFYRFNQRSSKVNACIEEISRDQRKQMESSLGYENSVVSVFTAVYLRSP